MKKQARVKEEENPTSSSVNILFYAGDFFLKKFSCSATYVYAKDNSHTHIHTYTLTHTHTHTHTYTLPETGVPTMREIFKEVLLKYH